MLNEDIEKLELFLAHNLPDLVCYLVGPLVVFIYLMTVNIPPGAGLSGTAGPGRRCDGGSCSAIRMT